MKCRKWETCPGVGHLCETPVCFQAYKSKPRMRRKIRYKRFVDTEVIEEDGKFMGILNNSGEIYTTRKYEHRSCANERLRAIANRMKLTTKVES
jgi:hypothetical protein